MLTDGEQNVSHFFYCLEQTTAEEIVTTPDEQTTEGIT